ncbi:Hypothetical protein CINCED_3A018310 [Cinara cedri]|uniref:Uncharacterized protein n=1 Tax=Cinara cedri TaxID=506608 RepID=A0A5E4NM69_9HEMI|nr:Hypothetical protein CINCED_3A018310 [Cinara cedri]
MERKTRDVPDELLFRSDGVFHAGKCPVPILRVVEEQDRRLVDNRQSAVPDTLRHISELRRFDFEQIGKRQTRQLFRQRAKGDMLSNRGVGEKSVRVLVPDGDGGIDGVPYVLQVPDVLGHGVGLDCGNNKTVLS